MQYPPPQQGPGYPPQPPMQQPPMQPMYPMQPPPSGGPNVGLIVGLVQAFLVGYHPSIGSIELTPDLLYPVMLVILLGVLLFRPTGLFGSEKVERV